MPKFNTKKRKFIVLFVEGDTDKVFYEKLIKYFKEKHKDKLNLYKIINIKGIGNYSSKVPGKFKNEIYPKYNEYRVLVFCSYDLDVFKFSAKPPVDWNVIESKLLDGGAEKVFFIKAENMIEDWFLYDLEGICEFLKIKKPKKLTGKNGFEKMKILFRKANKIYEKGSYTVKFLDKLDFEKIYKSIKAEISDLEQELISK